VDRKLVVAVVTAALLGMTAPVRAQLGDTPYPFRFSDPLCCFITLYRTLKRVDSTFVDLIPDNDPNKQFSGSVTANSRATNTVQGDIQNAQVGTFMAVNGEGFFVVQKPSAFSDNRPVFDGIDRYTRRGDFAPNAQGYLVNGSGYYLEGLPLDRSTGDPVGSTPSPVRLSSDVVPASATTRISYHASLPTTPATASANTTAGSEMKDARRRGQSRAGADRLGPGGLRRRL